MRSKHAILVGTLLRASGGGNILKYSRDKKKKRQVSSNRWGFGVLYFMLFAYCAVMAIGYGVFGLADAIPVMAILTITVIALFFTFIKTNGYLFAFKEYDMLMAMPFNPREILMDKFIHMYLRSVPFMSVISVSMLVGYAGFARPGIWPILAWIILTPFIPVVPMVVASLIGALLIAIGNLFKYKKIVQIILTFAIVIPLSLSGTYLSRVIENIGLTNLLNNISGFTEKLGNYYPPMLWFKRAVSRGGFLYFVLFIAVSIGVLELFTLIVGKFYRQINSRLLQTARGKRYKLEHQKRRSPVKAIVFKEYKRMMGSTIYATNCGMGQIMCLILGVVAIFVKGEKIISVVTEGATTSGSRYVVPIIPLVLYFFIGMIATTAVSLSLEGKNLWIVQSMPIDFMTLCKGKILFCMYMDVPFMLFPIITLGISFGASFTQIVLMLFEGFVLCLFSSLYGMVCGIKHARFDWDNEVEVVKQGTALLFYMFPNMFGSMGLIGLSIGLEFLLPSWIISLGTITLIALMAVLAWEKVKKYAGQSTI